MPIFIKLKNKDRIKLFNLLKEKINVSWDIFYPTLNISRTMFYNYLSGRYNLPRTIFVKIEKIVGIKIKHYEQIKQDRYSKKEIMEPKINNSFAEILGVLNGDGHVSNFKYEICVVLNSKEKDYYFYLKNLFEKTFGTTFTLFKEPTKIKLRIYSMNISNILTKKYGLPKGNKLGRLKIPKQVFSSRNLLISYIRGLFDTDGSFYIRRKKDPVIEISSADPRFLKEVKNALISLNFNVIKGSNKLVIYRKDDIINFYKLIKPANSKHLKKYQNYLNSSALVV